MRILQLTSSLPLSPTGSSAPFILHIGRALAARGHEVHLVAPFHPDLQWGDREGNLHLHFFKYAPLRRWHIWGYGQSLQSDVRLKPGVFFLLPPVAVSAARRLRRLIAGGSPPFDILHAHWLLPNGPIAAIANSARLPMIVSLHGSDMYVAGKAAIYRRAARFALARAAAVVGCSDDLTTRARGIHPDDRIYHTLPYGVDAETFRPSPEPAAPEPAGSMSILAAGRLVEKKGFEYLLRAMSLLKRTDVRLLIAGEGDLRSKLEEIRAELRLGDRVELLGNLTQPAMLERYRSCSIFALPSVHDSGGNVDGLPNVLMEAMSSGMAVVASRVGGVPAVIRDGENGLLVEERRPEQLAVAIDSIAGEASFRQSLAASARRTIVEGFTWAHYAQRFEAILEGVRRSC